MEEYRITLASYNESTSFNIPLSEDELSLLKDIEKATKGKMVSLIVEEK